MDAMAVFRGAVLGVDTELSIQAVPHLHGGLGKVVCGVLFRRSPRTPFAGITREQAGFLAMYTSMYTKIHTYTH